MAQAWVGIYWTLPVNWAGFRHLPTDVDAAAAASRTIRYQRARVRAGVRDLGDTLANEIALMDVRTDRATDTVRDVVRQAAPRFGRVAGLIAVNFAAAHGWRRNPYVEKAAEELGLLTFDLPPTPVLIDGVSFDPIRHFERWRTQDAAAKTRLRVDALSALSAALAATPEGDNRWRTIADRLNAAGTRTIQGGAWTPENVRKLAGRLRA